MNQQDAILSVISFGPWKVQWGSVEEGHTVKGLPVGRWSGLLIPFFFCHLNSIERPSFSIRFHNGHKRRFSGAFDSSRCRSQSRSDKCSVRATLLSAQRKIESSAGRLKNVPIYQFRSKKGTEQPKRTVVLFFVERVSSPPPHHFFFVPQTAEAHNKCCRTVYSPPSFCCSLNSFSSPLTTFSWAPCCLFLQPNELAMQRLLKTIDIGDAVITRFAYFTPRAGASLKPKCRLKDLLS